MKNDISNCNEIAITIKVEAQFRLKAICFNLLKASNKAVVRFNPV